MTVVTIIATRNVRRMFAGRRIAVVAGSAATEDLRMVHGVGWHPDIAVVAVLANVCRLNVSRILADRCDAVVAVDAITNDAGVIKIGGQPPGRRVAVFT